MRDTIIKVRVTAQEKDAIFAFSDQRRTTASEQIRRALHEICAQKTIGRETREDLVVLRRRLNAALDAPSEGSFASAKQAVAQVLRRLS